VALLKPTSIIIHHSATPDCDLLSWHAIEQYHRKQGWSDIGYHAGIEQVRGDYVCLFGRPDTLPGAHTRGQNSRSLGFVFVGNFDDTEPERRMLALAARRVLAPWCLRFDLTPSSIVPHSDYAAKSCPGKRFDMATLRNLVWNECHALRDG
jgi:hypothetical protein